MLIGREECARQLREAYSRISDLESGNARAAALVESMSEDQERARRLERLRVDACELLLDADCDPQVATWEEAGKAALRLLREATLHTEARS